MLEERNSLPQTAASTEGGDSLAASYTNNEQSSTPSAPYTSIIGGSNNTIAPLTPPNLSYIPVQPSRTPKSLNTRAPSPARPRIITLDVGGRIFRAYAITLQESDWLSANIKRWLHSNSPTNPLFLDTDPDLFEHILRYLRRPEVFPLFWSPAQGFDYDLYNRLEVEAQHFGIQALEDWISEKKYLEAVTVRYSAPLTREIDRIGEEKTNPNVEYSRHNFRRMEQVYVCPRGILVHRGRREMCGMACAKAQGTEPMQFDEEEHHEIVTFTRTTEFDGSVCRL